MNDLARRHNNLADDEVFLDAFIVAARIAQTTHQQEKLDALRNGLVNSISPDAPDVDEQARFFRLVDQFSPSHIVMLRLLDRPTELFQQHIGHFEEVGHVSLAELVNVVEPQFADRYDWRDLLVADLADARVALGFSSLGDIQSADGRFQRMTTSLGQRFLSFISID
ncbi:hypothetical protein ABZX12_02890 [Kribbella sp. NPDC003505]|uniref:hypothetical protein n=1 Tax=Kribbella sp. NPDC003505 TaxID=3154448 RepID=UPI0033BBC622